MGRARNATRTLPLLSILISWQALCRVGDKQPGNDDESGNSQKPRGIAEEVLADETHTAPCNYAQAEQQYAA